MKSKRGSERTVGWRTLVGAAFVVLLIPAAAMATPVVTWNPQLTEVSVPVGETVTVPVSLTASRDLHDVSIVVSRSLREIVTVEPSWIGELEVGTSREVLVTATTDLLMEPETLMGRLIPVGRWWQWPSWLRLPLPRFGNLKIDVIEQAVFESEVGGFAVASPPGFVSEVFSETESFGSVTFYDTQAATGTVAFTVRWFDDYPERVSLSEWGDQGTWPTPDGSWRSLYVLTTIAGHEALQDPDYGTAYIPVGGRLYHVVNGLGINPVFVDRDVLDKALESLTFSQQ